MELECWRKGVEDLQWALWETLSGGCGGQDSPPGPQLCLGCWQCHSDQMTTQDFRSSVVSTQVVLLTAAALMFTLDVAFEKWCGLFVCVFVWMVYSCAQTLWTLRLKSPGLGEQTHSRTAAGARARFSGAELPWFQRTLRNGDWAQRACTTIGVCPCPLVAWPGTDAEFLYKGGGVEGCSAREELFSGSASSSRNKVWPVYVLQNFSITVWK